MSWKERLEKLPLIFGGIVIEPNEWIEEFYGSTKFVAVHKYVPLVGATYHFSMSGPINDRGKFITELIAELGTPHDIDTENPQLWHYFWKSPCTDIPETLYHRNVGRERIHEICQEHDLNHEEERSVDEFLAVHQILMYGDKEDKIFIQYGLLQLTLERRQIIIDAYVQVVVESMP